MKLVATALLALSLHTPAAPAEVKTTDITFTTRDGQKLGGRVFEPAATTGKLPGLVLVHGSGGGNGWRDLEAEADAFARQGLVVLAPDKRDAGYSSTRRDYHELAGDALAAFAVLKKHPSVGRAGLWGISEGGWVAPIAANRSTSVDFLVTVGGPGLSPLRTQSWNAANKLDRAGIQGSLRSAYARTFHRLAADAGLFASAYHDPAPELRRIKQPVLALWGTADNQVPPAESAQRFQANIPAGLNVRFFAGAGHSLHQSSGALTPGYADAVGSWVREVAAGRVPAAVTEPLPAQPRSVDTPPSAWWESWQPQLGTMALMSLAFLAYTVRRLGPGSWSARLVAIAGSLSLVAFAYTLISLLLSSTSRGVQAGPLLMGRPLTWLAAQLLAAVAAVAALTCLTQWRASSFRVRLTAAAGLVFIPWGVYWGLLVP
ncbi:alpha/beta hydrolase family protein [Nonomuraea sp. NPDC059023]|uniref:alpha/beta hydrolase family protein n=1 Tax=unclassified Nonomuraea TaxID=2593643 RepID=UPI0036A220FC